MSKLSSFVRLAAAVGALALLTACSPSSPPGQNDGTPGTEGEVDRNATVVYADIVTPSSLDPHRSYTENDITMLRVLYDTLTNVENGEPIPMLAESWDLDNDAATFTIRLREGVTFSDGEPVNAEAVKINIERVINDPASTLAGALNEIVGSVDVVDDLTAQFNLIGPGGALPTLLASRPGMLISPAALETPDAVATNPVGAGAMVLTYANPGTSYTFERRADYWDDDAFPYADLEYVIQTDTSTRLNALRAGESTMTGIVGPQIAEAEGAGLKVYMTELPSTGFSRVLFNAARSEFGSKLVRQAMNLAVDRDAIAATLYSGHCAASAQPYPEGNFARSEVLDDSGWVSHDPERAKELLAEAGLPEGFTFTAAVPSLAFYQNIAQVVQQSFADIGVTMDIQVMDATQSRSAFVTGSVDAMVGQYGGSTDPGLFAQGAYTASGGDNPGKLTTPRMEGLIADTQRSVDTAERGKAYEALMAEVFEMGPAHIVICHGFTSVAAQQNTQGLVVDPTGGASGLRTLQVTKQ